MKTYTPPRLTAHGDIQTLTGTLGDPFTGDTSFDLDGDVLTTGPNSVDQCPTTDQDLCVPTV